MQQRIVGALLTMIVLLTILAYEKQETISQGVQIVDHLDPIPASQIMNNGNNEGHGEDETEDKEESSGINEICTVVNPLNRGFIDLSGLSAMGNEGRALPWGAKGFDNGVNYTLGICSSPMKKIHDQTEIQDGLNSSMMGGYYVDKNTGKYVSLGEFSTTPSFKGRKLTLTYENGSYCNNIIDESTGEKLRRSTTLIFTCDRDMLSKASVSYISRSNDCNYIFEVRSHHACPTAAKSNNLAAVWIFLIIVLAAIVGYFSGGILFRQLKINRGN